MIKKIFHVAALLLGCSSVVVMAAVGGGIDGNISNTTMATRVLLDLSTHPHARCLDGSVAGMYVRPGWGSGASVWNLFQEGGGSCHSLSDCAHRAQTSKGSSSSWPAAIELVGRAGGVYFSPDPVLNPLLWNANVAYLIYCDGGAFSGDNFTTAATVAGLQFRGQAIIRAAIETLAATTTLSAATAVVISGCSEGGVATFAHLDWMASLVRAAAPTVAKIAGLADSGYYPGDGSPYSHVPKQQFLYEAQNASGCLSPSCLAANPKAPWGCVVAEVNHRFIQTPVFALQSIFDTNQLGTAGCKDASCAIPYMRWLNTSVVGFATAPGRATGAFVDMCSRHCNTNTVPLIDGYSSLGAFGEWFSGLPHDVSEGRRLWMQTTAVPFEPKAPYCAHCCL